MTDETPPIMDKPTKVQRRRAVLSELQVILLGLIVLALVLLPSIVIWRQSQNKGLLQSVHTVTAFIADCTSPQGKCYKQGQANTAATIGKVDADTQEIVILAAVCAKEPGNGSVAQVTACVNKGLK